MTPTPTPAPGSDIQGRALHLAVAEKVMGWSITEPPDGDHYPNYDWLDSPSNYPHLTDVDGDLLLWRYPGADPVRWVPSERIAQAWEVVERMTELDWEYDITLRSDFDPPQHEASFDNGTIGDGWRCEFDIAPTAQLALCRAALKVMESLT